MPQDIYEIVAGAARYWFLFLMALIVFRSFRWYRKDQKQQKKQRKLMPDAGYIGEMVVIRSEGNELAPGDTLPVSWEGVLGCTRINDLCVPAPGVAGKHFMFRFEEKLGLLIEPYRGRTVQVDGESYAHKEFAYMFHGSFLKVGETVLRLRMFSGFETRLAMPVAAPQGDGQPGAHYAPYLPPVPSPEQMAAWHQMVQQQLMQQQMAWMQWAQRQQSAQPETQEEMEEKARSEAELEQVFYPPVMDEEPEEEGAEETSEWSPEDPYAAYRRPAQPRPRCTDRYYDELLDEDLTDAARPPRSAYVGEDEARIMKQEVWDRMLGGEKK